MHEQLKFLIESAAETANAIGVNADRQEGLPPLTTHLGLIGLVLWLNTRRSTKEESENVHNTIDESIYTLRSARSFFYPAGSHMYQLL
jgi:hypothetical protein